MHAFYVVNELHIVELSDYLYSLLEFCINVKNCFIVYSNK